MELTSSGYKQVARGALKGHWGLAIISWIFCSLTGAFLFSIPFLLTHFGCLIFAMFTFEIVPHYFLLLLVSESALMLIYFFFGSAMELGYIDLNLCFLDQRKASFSTIFGKFDLLFKALFYRLISTFLKLISLCMCILPCFYVTFAYSMTPYILEEKEDYSVFQAMKASRRVMRGHKWELFCLRMSFFGWYLLGILTLGLAFIYAKPYMHVAETVFFNEISGRADAFYGR